MYYPGNMEHRKVGMQKAKKTLKTRRIKKLKFDLSLNDIKGNNKIPVVTMLLQAKEQC